MAKITRKHQKIFAGGVPVTNVVAEFGSLAQGAAGYTGDPDGIQTTEYEGGWGEAVINNFAPCIQDFNALFYLITYQLAYLLQAGIAEWNSLTSYYIGSLVHDGSGGIYMSLTNDNVGHAVSTAGEWTPIFSRKIQNTNAGSGNITADNTDWFIIWNSLIQDIGNQYVILPTPSASNSGREILVKFTGSDANGTPTVRANDNSTIDGEAHIHLVRWTTRRFMSDGTNWQTI